MKTWLLNHWEALRTNFWFIPSLMVLGAFVLAFVALRLDRSMADENWFLNLGVTVERGPEGSRQLLATVAGTMITIASLTFSITIVALQLASTQFGPRLIQNFMRDRGNQFTLGTFIATFVYCLIVLRSVNGTDENTYVPHLSVMMAFVLTIVSIGVLIYFINHTAHAIQVDRVIREVVSELHQAIDGIFPDRKDAGESSHGYIAADLPGGFEADAKAFNATRSGYVQGIDHGKLKEVAIDRDLVLQLETRPGRFVVEGGPLGYAWPSGRADESVLKMLQAAFYVGDQRTITQDVEFAIDQLVEIAIRALSPGINDTFTAMSCVDRLGEILITIAGRQFPPVHRYDDSGTLRVVACPSTKAGVVDAAFHKIRQSATTNVAVACRVLEVIAAIGRRTDDPEFVAALRRHADLIVESCGSKSEVEADRAEIQERFEVARKALESPKTLDPA